MALALRLALCTITCCHLLARLVAMENEGRVVDAESKRVRIEGDLILGGLFPMHESGTLQHPCGAIKAEKGIQRMEAMLFAMDQINRDQTLLPNLTLGALVLDTCSSDTYALEQSMAFVSSSMYQGTSNVTCEGSKFSPQKPVVGVIGAAASGVSIMVANILRLFKIPQISYASTSTELSDKTRFEYFSRVLPPDNFQAQAMVDVVKRFDWKYVSTVAAEGEYGEKGIASFTELAGHHGICVAVAEKITRNAQLTEFDHIVKNLASKPNARAVVMFVDEDNIRKLLAAVRKAKKVGQFFWVGSDSWGAKIHPVRDQEDVAQGAITILPKRKAVQGFTDYFKLLRPRVRGEKCSDYYVEPSAQELPTVRNHARGIEALREVMRKTEPRTYINCRNPWFKEFWRKHFNCTFREKRAQEKRRRRCTAKEKLDDFAQEGLVPFVIDAVYAMAHGLHNLISHECGPQAFQTGKLCSAVRPVPPGQKLLPFIRNVSFIGKENQVVRFNEDGDAYGSYKIYQYQRLPSGKYDYIPIGRWEDELVSSARLRIDLTLTKWNPGSLDTNLTIPQSKCSKPCPKGHIRSFLDNCCWNCVPCREDFFIDNDTCVPCDLGWMPDENSVYCIKLSPEYMTWDSLWAIIPMVFASAGIIFTIFTFAIFVRFSRTPIIMASSRELCYVLLFGILLCYLMSFVILAKPTTTTCTIQRIGLGVGLCTCYSAIFTKTNRISRIFNQSIKSIKRPSYTSPKSQIVICLGIVSVQLIGCIAWLIIEKPSVKETHPIRTMSVLSCGVSTFSVMMSLVYNMILIVLCTLYAFKTRKIPENFNEAKYIGFTMYSTCIVWLAFVPIYFGTNNDYKMQIASLCMCLSISATVSLMCLFSPKLYIVVFQPYKNVRQGTQVVGNARPGHSLRFAAYRSGQALASITASVTYQTPTSSTCQRPNNPQQPPTIHEEPDGEVANKPKDVVTDNGEPKSLQNSTVLAAVVNEQVDDTGGGTIPP